MSLIVQKFGGTSVANIERIRNVAKKVLGYHEQGNKVVVVLSAMAGQTDGLIQLAHEMTERPDPREMDVLMATGEQVSVALFTMALKSMGYEARSFLGFQVPIHTDQLYGKARINDIDTETILKELDQNKIVAVAGFQGLDAEGNIRTSSAEIGSYPSIPSAGPRRMLTAFTHKADLGIGGDPLQAGYGSSIYLSRHDPIMARNSNALSDLVIRVRMC